MPIIKTCILYRADRKAYAMKPTRKSASEKDKLRRKAEELLRSTPEDVSGLGSQDLAELLHELRVHRAELEIQNEELRLAQMELAEARDLYFDLYELAPVGYLRLDQKGFITRANLTAANLLGQDRSALLQLPLTSFMDEEGDRAFRAFCQGLIGANAKQTCEVRLAPRDGTAIHARLEGAPELDQQGDYIGIRLVMVDVTKRKQAERLLQLQEHCIDRASVAIFWITPEGRFIRVNETAAKDLGFTRRELEGMYVHDVDPNHTKAMRAERWRMLKEKGLLVFETEHRDKKGKHILCEVTSQYMEFEGEEMEFAFAKDITQRQQAEQSLRRIEWMLSPQAARDISLDTYESPYGDLVALNQSRLILDSVGEETLTNIAMDYLSMLGTSAAIYESNGDYALGIFSSGWCRFMDQASRNLCGDVDNQTALDSGMWHCHESCWTQASKRALETGEPVDIVCAGGLHMYALPVLAGGKPVGAINVGYGDPPTDPETLQELAELYQVDQDELAALAQTYESRPPFIIELAKQRLASAASLIGEIVERKQAEKIISYYERRNQALLDHSPLCHKIVDLDFNLRYMSQTGFGMLKIDQDADVYGKPYPFSFFPEAFREEMIKTIQKVKETGKTLRMESLACDSEANEAWLESTILPVRDDDGHIVYVTVVTADTTQRKKDEAEKDSLQNQLSHAQKMDALGTLSSGIAHDFNNLLAAIMGYAELALDELPEDTPVQQDLEAITKAAARAKNLVRQILTFSRGVKGKKRPLSINKEAEEVCAILSRTLPKMIDLDIQLQKDIWPATADPDQIEQVLINLATNASDAMEGSGRITITTKNVDLQGQRCEGCGETMSERHVLIAVSDTGMGMSPDVQDKIFEPFFTTKGVGKGTGLGLSTAYGIVQGHGGHICCQSQEGKGSTFFIYLPADTQGQLSSGSDQGEPAENLGGSGTILVADDEPAVRDIAQKVLSRSGYEVLTAASGEEALAVYEERGKDIDLVLLDLGMPGMGGKACLVEMRRLDPEAKLLIASGYIQYELTDELESLGAMGVVSKPYRKADMLKAVKAALGS